MPDQELLSPELQLRRELEEEQRRRAVEQERLRRERDEAAQRRPETHGPAGAAAATDQEQRGATTLPDAARAPGTQPATDMEVRPQPGAASEHDQTGAGGAKARHRGLH